jgi:DNA-binding CsgD family transcriptional regulator
MVDTASTDPPAPGFESLWQARLRSMTLPAPTVGLAPLGERDREILIRWIAGEREDEIAAVMGVAPATVRNRLMRLLALARRVQLGGRDLELDVFRRRTAGPV